jgi:subtilisin family serine protease
MLSQFQYDESVNYFGMHVEDAWYKGCNGSGVTIAVIDIGIIADIYDIRNNLVQKKPFVLFKGSFLNDFVIFKEPFFNEYQPRIKINVTFSKCNK